MNNTNKFRARAILTEIKFSIIFNFPKKRYLAQLTNYYFSIYCSDISPSELRVLRKTCDYIIKLSRERNSESLRHFFNILNEISKTQSDGRVLMMEDEIDRILAMSSAPQIATGELLVLKNTIKKFCKGPQKSNLIKLANSELGRICASANHTNLNKIQHKCNYLKELAKSNEQDRLKYELSLVRVIGL